LSIPPLTRLAEQRIREACGRGELDGLPGRGRPLSLEDDSRVPEDLRLAYKILKNAGYVPPEIEAQKELRQVEDLLAGAPDEKQRYQALKRLNFLTMKLGVARPCSALLEEHAYSARILDRLVKPTSKD